MSEAELQKNIAIYLRSRFPEVIFHSDFGSGAKLSYKQAITQKIQNGGRRAWPDLFIAEPRPRCVDGNWSDYEWHGLFIELKKEGTRLKKKNGEWTNSHIEEQARVLEELYKRGYKALFGVGYENTLQIIEDYLD